MMISMLRWTAATGLLTLLLASGELHGEDRTEKELEKWWVDLAKPDPEASRALLKFADHPGAAVAFFEKKLKPLQITSKEVDALVKKLGSENEAIWRPAFEELDYLDPRLAMDLKEIMDKFTKPPARQRLVELMSGRPADSLKGKQVNLRKVGDVGFNFFAGGSWWAEHKVERINKGYSNPKSKWTRAMRVIVLLDHLQTKDSLRLLKRMAVGHPKAHPTEVARKLALERAKAKK